MRKTNFAALTTSQESGLDLEGELAKAVDSELAEAAAAERLAGDADREGAAAAMAVATAENRHER